jgi:hypothetical protein
VPDVQDFYALLLLHDAVDYAINMRPIAIEKVPELMIFRRRSTAVGKFFQLRMECLRPPYHRCAASESAALMLSNNWAKSRQAREEILT